MASRLGPSAVQINVSGVQQTPYGAQEGEGVGSGVIYRSDGYIITNHHVVEGARRSTWPSPTAPPSEARSSAPTLTTEIAVIQVDRDDLPAASFAEGRDPVVGQMAVAVGSPSGFESTVTSGIVSGVGREVPSEYTGGRQDNALVDLIQTDAAISPGNSGGALANQDGEVIGINVAYLPPSETGAVNIGFAIPSDTAISVADQLIETGEAVAPVPRRLSLRPHPRGRKELRQPGRFRGAGREGRSRRPRRRRRHPARRRRNGRRLRESPQLGRLCSRPCATTSPARWSS